MTLKNIFHQKLFPPLDLTINQIVNYLYYQRSTFSKTERFLCCEDDVTYSIYSTNKLISTKIKMNGYAQFDVLVYFRKNVFMCEIFFLFICCFFSIDVK